MALRVITGELKGRNLPPPLKGVRPTPQKVRLALFNILYSLRFPFAGSTWLDLFCGTGSIGVEALSRGAARVVFVDHSFAVLRRLDRFLTEARVRERAVLVQADLPTQLVRVARHYRGTFDLVFLDPPYEEPFSVGSVLENPVFFSLFHPEGVVVYECRKGAPREELPHYEMFDERRYGQVVLRFYRLKEGKDRGEWI